MDLNTERRLIEDLTSNPIETSLSGPQERTLTQRFVKEGMQLLEVDPKDKRKLREALKLLFSNYLTESESYNNMRARSWGPTFMLLVTLFMMGNRIGVVGCLLSGTAIIYGGGLIRRKIFNFRMKRVRQRFFLYREKLYLDSVTREIPELTTDIPSRGLPRLESGNVYLDGV